jgi:CubicO group peptidase (beta-lactamase class C family)
MSANGTSHPRRSRPARAGWAAVIAASVLIAGCTSGHPSAPSSSGRTPTSAIDARVAAGIDHAMAQYTPYDRIRAILVQANGRTVFERYYRSSATEYHNVASVTKTVMSTLVGIAVGDGSLRLDQPLAQLLPSYASAMTPAVAHTTLRQVLTMTAGLAGSFNPAGDLGFVTSPDWVRAILTHPAKPPGDRSSTPAAARTCCPRS